MKPSIRSLCERISKYSGGDPGEILRQTTYILSHESEFSREDLETLISAIREKIFESNIFRYRELKNGLNQILNAMP